MEVQHDGKDLWKWWYEVHKQGTQNAKQMHSSKIDRKNNHNYYLDCSLYLWLYKTKVTTLFYTVSLITNKLALVLVQGTGLVRITYFYKETQKCSIDGLSYEMRENVYCVKILLNKERKKANSSDICSRRVSPSHEIWISGKKLWKLSGHTVRFFSDDLSLLILSALKDRILDLSQKKKEN